MAEERKESNDSREEESGRLGGYATTFDETAVVPFPGDIRTAARSALWAGPVAGTAMGLVMMIIYALMGLGFWLPMGLIAMPILGATAMLGGATAVITGMVLHLIISAIVAVVFAIVLVSLLGRVGLWVGATAGILYGLLVWVVAQYIVMPVTYPLLAVMFVPWAFGLAHAVYGLVLGLLPTAYRVTREEFEAAQFGATRPEAL